MTITCPQFSFALQYPRDFQLSHWKLSELFQFLDNDVLAAIELYCSQTNGTRTTNSEETVLSALRRGVLCQMPLESGSRLRNDWIAKFRQVYGVVSCLGVTFNPFDIEVHVLSRLKRLLLILRFALLQPASFAVWVEQTAMPSGTTLASRTLTIRCLDGSIGLNHLTKNCFKVHFASGTLEPAPMLAKSLRLPSIHQFSFLQTGHVINCVTQVRVGAIRQLIGDPACRRRSLHTPQSARRIVSWLGLPTPSSHWRAKD